MRIALIVKPGREFTGVGRYASRLCAGLQALGHEVLIVHPVVPLPGWLVSTIRRLLGWDLRAFFENYPVWARYPRADLYHITSQNLATLMLFRPPPSRTIVTVHDLIPLMTRDIPEVTPSRHGFETFFDRIAIRGLARGTGLIAVSEYTKQTLVNELGCLSGEIVVVHEGIG